MAIPGELPLEAAFAETQANQGLWVTMRRLNRRTMRALRHAAGKDDRSNRPVIYWDRPVAARGE